MDGYRQFWNRLIYFNEGLGPLSIERFWATLAVFAVICLIIGLSSNGRLRSLAPAATILILGAYGVAIVPFLVWAASCGGCGASVSADLSRSFEAVFLQQYWGGVFTIGVAALWIGVLISSGVSAVTTRNLAFDDEAFDAEPPPLDEMPPADDAPIAQDAPPADETPAIEEPPAPEQAGT